MHYIPHTNTVPLAEAARKAALTLLLLSIGALIAAWCFIGADLHQNTYAYTAQVEDCTTAFGILLGLAAVLGIARRGIEFVAWRRFERRGPDLRAMS